MLIIPAEIIKEKRDGKELSPQQIESFVDEYVQNRISDYQMAAFLMAVFFQGMTDRETWALTSAMLHSGEVLNLSDIAGPKIDKHSTGGVGDKTSLVIGPVAAVAGVNVPMISGRGLGHTGGTLDKLESIPGFRTDLTLERFKSQVSELGLCFMGQTADICPADKKMYALRDVTATVECIPLICASIMSKKLAEGIDGLLLDVKVGAGAFMKKNKEATVLARALSAIARLAKKRVTALLTDMSQPLGNKVGNALEVQECLDILQGKGPEDLKTLCIELSAHMIAMGKKAKNLKDARSKAQQILSSGQAFSLFQKIVEKQGGDLSRLPKAPATQEFLCPKTGYVASLDAEKIGWASLALGAGRLKTEDSIDPSAGVVLHKKIGSPIKKGESLATLHFDGKRDVQSALEYMKKAYSIGLQKRQAPSLIVKTL